MSIKTIYTCDKCGKEQTDSKQFWTVGVTANCQPYVDNSFVTGKHMQVCRPCLESLGIHVKTKEGQPAPAIQTVEELIREIISRCAS